MTFDVWYDLGALKKPEPSRPFQQWRLYIPVPRTSAEAGKAVEKILDKHKPILITIAKTREKKMDKPRHD